MAESDEDLTRFSEINFNARLERLEKYTEYLQGVLTLVCAAIGFLFGAVLYLGWNCFDFQSRVFFGGGGTGAWVLLMLCACVGAGIGAFLASSTVRTSDQLWVLRLRQEEIQKAVKRRQAKLEAVSENDCGPEES